MYAVFQSENRKVKVLASCAISLASIEDKKYELTPWDKISTVRNKSDRKRDRKNRWR